MKRDYSRVGWLIANLVLLSASMLLAWFMLAFESPPNPEPISGWDFIFRRITNSIELSLEYGFGWLWLLSFLQGVGGIFAIGYVVFRIISVAKLKSQTGNKILSIVLAVVVIVFLSRDLLFRLNLPLPGYWLFILGLVSSAIFEWRSSMVETQI